MHPAFVLLAVLPFLPLASTEPARAPLFRTLDLDRGERQTVELSNGQKVIVKLLDVQETRDALRSAVRLARVTVEIDGTTNIVTSGNYSLPVTLAGVQIDCPVARGYYQNHDAFEDSWGLVKDARLRLWPAGSPWLEPGTFVYPARQRWFAGPTQMGNEPAFVDGGDRPPADRRIYYHSGLDIGGCEGLIDVVAATDGRVISAGGQTLREYPDLPYYTQKPRDGVYVLDAHGWLYRYVHLQSVDPAVRPGERVRQGQKIGVLGKEGGSGGWSHLHFDIKSRQPSGKWGVQEGYAFLWEAYRREHHPPLLAVARPHQLIAVGETATLDGSRSWSAAGKINRYEWTFHDGSRAEGPTVTRTYREPGSYSEILQVTDAAGHRDYDFAVVQVMDPTQTKTEKYPPTIHGSYAPSFGIRAGDPVTFKVRTFRADVGNETWDFGDGSPPVQVRSDGNARPHDPNGYATTVHRFARPGHYLVRVEGLGHDGLKATGHLQVRVGAQASPAPSDTSYEDWLERKLLPEQEANAMLRAFVARQLQPLPLPQTRDEWLRRRARLRHDILTVLGLDDLVPPRWDLKLTAKGTIQRDGYRIEKLTFETYPGFANAAVLYIPDGQQGRVPGIVSISGHTHVSKAADYVQQRNVNLVKRGCVVLAYDYFGYGDRKTGDHPNHPRGANGHDIRTFSYSRRTATALEVLDAIRALDVLTARAEVDPERIGFTGESGGSNSTYWIAALDPRVKLAVPVSSVSTFDYWIRTDANWDWHQRPPGIRRLADIGTLLALHAPNPLVVISSKRGTDDEEFPLDEAEKSYRWARHVYALLGAENAATHYESTTAHGYQEDKRIQLYRAVERWLKPPQPRGGVELPAMVEPVEACRCGLPENNHTFRSVFAEWVNALPRSGEKDDPAVIRKFLRERLGWPDEIPAPRATLLSREEKGPWAVAFWILEPEAGIRLPAMVIGKRGASGLPTTLIPGRDKQAVARTLAAGRAVLAFDLRGCGEMRHGKGGSWTSMAGPPYPEILASGEGSFSNWAWFAGRPVAGQWALDILQAARFCREKLGAPAVAVDAGRDFGWPALLAAAAAPEVIPTGTVTLRLESLHDDLRARGDQALADVPGLLERLDIPQLRRLWPGGEVHVQR
jgi:murein DD-endopeptidase MepM/ murein hydrolase activator NlpD/dienelactone hydrolase